MGFRHLVMPLYQFVVTSNSLHQNSCNWIRVRCVVGNSPLSLITIIRHGFEITPRLFG